MIIDSFIFFDEYDLLEGRLEYLDSVVDYFIICEANVTHSANSKPFNLPSHWDRYKKYLNKIIYIPYDVDLAKFDLTKPTWAADLANAQRNQIATVLHAAPDDAYILLSDVDEVPDRNKIVHPVCHDMVAQANEILLGQSLFYYNLNKMMYTIWPGTVITTVRRFKEVGATWLRENRFNFMSIQQCGWHLSYWGNAEQIRNKILNFADQEWNQPQFTDIEYIRKQLAAGVDLYGREDNKFVTPPDDILPPEFLACFKKYEPK